MFTDVSGWYEYPQNPTFENTDKAYFNCGGYALSVYKWYLPAPSSRSYKKINREICNGKYRHGTKVAAKHICNEFKLSIVSEKKMRHRAIDPKNVEVIAFRFEKQGIHDFHFMKLGTDGYWYEKRGGSPFIYAHEYNDVFNVWHSRYNGPIIFMARARK